jgi:HK97 gp10 family phage protein
MPVDITCTISGLEGVEAALEEISAKLAEEYALEACNKGANVLEAAVAARTPVREGLLVGSIEKVPVVAGKLGTVAVAVGFGEQGYKARFIEFGHRTPGLKSFVPANPFMRNAFETSKDQAVEAFTQSITESIEKGGK